MQQPMELFNHISGHDLERYCLGMVKDEAELAPLEEHLSVCPACGERAESTRDYVDAIRAALITIREDWRRAHNRQPTCYTCAAANPNHGCAIPPEIPL
ncbi:MAG: hypothetical protein ABSC08_07350 [Bryobacteraceae bacterium]|jgi:hypothetical protein